MSTYRKQSRKPKPLPVDKQVEIFKRSMKALGYDVQIQHGSGRYTPQITVSVWPKRDKDAA